SPYAGSSPLSPARSTPGWGPPTSSSPADAWYACQQSRLMSAAPKTAPAGLQAAEANTRWLAEHPEVARAHRGQWVCIVDEQVVVADPDWRAFAEKVK